MSETEEAYRIGTVAKLTGLDVHTIRAWERRYEAVVPGRTDGGTRVYSPSDVRKLRLLRDATAAGDKIGVIAGLDEDSLLRRLRELGGTVTKPTTSVDPERFVEALLGAAESMVAGSIDEELRRSAQVLGPREWYVQVLRPLMIEVGERWERGELSVAQEHFLSERVELHLNNVLDVVRGVRGGRKGSILLGCVANEVHSLPLYGVALSWALSGFKVHLLGRMVPPETLRSAIDTLDPKWIGLSQTTPRERTEVEPLYRAYAEACTNRRWIVGGHGALAHRELIESLGGHFADGDGTQLVS